jgi:hypothetical protein
MEKIFDLKNIETWPFYVKTGFRQECVMSAVLFNLVIDWVMRKTTEDSPRRIRWSLFSTLQDLDFADDLEMQSHTHTSIFKRRQTGSKHMEKRLVYV